jgi:isopenicillin-N epimerase
MKLFKRREVLGMGVAVLATPSPTFAQAQWAPSPARQTPQTGPLAALPPLAPDDEPSWARIAAQYDVLRTPIPLENGNFGVMAVPVLAAYTGHLVRVNQQGAYYSRRNFTADAERVRDRVATSLGVDSAEIVFTRGATEALQMLVAGYTRLRAGDAVLYADLDYDSIQSAMDWLAVRRGVQVVRINLPEPATYQGLIDAYAAAIEANPRIRLMLLTHVSHRTGLRLPLQEIIAMARARGVDAIVDSAHAWGQVPLNLRALGVDFAGLNGHKWIGAPLGVGLAYIRRERIGDIEPFMGNSEYPSVDDIRNRVHTGTSSFATVLALEDALNFHEQLGPEAKFARLAYLRNLWTEPTRELPGLQVLAPADPRLHGAITSFRLRGQTTVESASGLARRLLQEAGIFTVHRIGVAAGACIRVTPALFNSATDMQQLAAAIKRLNETPT